MYLYPVEHKVYSQDNDTGNMLVTQQYNYATCIPDCAAYDMSMVNNPILMRCEYLGFGCLYGNYTHGCLKLVNGNGKYYKYPNGLMQLHKLRAWKKEGMDCRIKSGWQGWMVSIRWEF
ncbi:hypothetical protein FGO68_gene10869 [Halteria grandinella]|uniref:Uncharacterized protein n=1 Tax=Halteria grandinella TaxID=5974 RepID=A0A8J8P534_HALGN|nr:hypothetical protein FGO68_gene10869 [Halteria grandinella]